MADPRGAEIAKLEALFSENPDGRVFTHLAEAYRRAGDPERARVLLETGLARHADYASAHVVHGRVLLDLGLEAEAEAAFRRVLGLDPENLVALRALGDLARRAGRAAEALGYYEQLLLRDPSSEELEAIIGELRETAAPQPAEAGDPGQADEGQPDAGGDAGAAEGAEPGIGAAAGVVEAAYGAEEPAGPEAEEPAALGPQEPAGSGTEEPAALEPQEPPAPEAEQPVAPEPAAAVEGWADEGAAASHVEPAAFAVGSESPGVAEAAPSAEVEAPVADEAGPEDADRLVASAEMDEAGALGAAEAGPEEPAAAFEPAPPEDVAAEAVVDPEAIVTWHAPRPGDAGAFPPEASAAEPDAAGGDGGEAAAEEPAVTFGGLADVSGADVALAGESGDAPPEIPLDEELELEISSLADLPDATHSLLFEDEYTDPESAALPLEAWAPLTDQEMEGAGAAADGDAGLADLEVGPGDLEAEHGPEAAELADPETTAEEAGAPPAVEPGLVVADAEEAVPEPVVEPGDVGGEEAGVAVAAQAESPASEAVAAAPEPTEPEEPAEPLDAAASVAAEEPAEPLEFAASVPAEEAVDASDVVAAGPADEPGGPQDVASVSPAEEPTGEAPAEVAAAEPPPAAGLSGEAVEGPESLGGEVVTETLADLYLAQGLFDRAVALYRQLLESQPGDARLEARLREAEDRLAGMARAEDGGPGWEVVEAAESEAGAGERIEDVEAVWTGGAGADAQDVSPYAWPEEGEAGPDGEADGGATIGQYLDALLQWKPGEAKVPAAPAEAVEVLPAEPTAEAGGGRDGEEGGERESDDDDDLEMFRAWLQSLKR